MVDSPVALGGTLGTKLSGHGELVGEKVKAMQIASEAGFGESIIQSNQGGGGWSLCCAAAGEMSTVTRDITWTYRCKAHSSYGCPAKLRIIYRQVTDTMCVLTSTGWNHVHSGLIQTSTGLPPPIKIIIDDTAKDNPTMKFAAIWNLLVEKHGIEPQMKTRVRNYFYTNAKGRSAEHTISLGVSSYGSVQAWVNDNQLLDLLQAHSQTPTRSYLDVAGVIGAIVKPQENMCAVMISTARLLLDAFAISTLGYSKGQLHADHTPRMRCCGRRSGAPPRSSWCWARSRERHWSGVSKFQ